MKAEFTWKSDKEEVGILDALEQCYQDHRSPGYAAKKAEMQMQAMRMRD